MIFDMTPDAYRAIFEGGDAQRVEKEPYTPPPRPEDRYTIAARIQDLFYAELEGGLFRAVNPPIQAVEPLARRLVALTADATGATANVRAALVGALESSRHAGRAWEIKAAARHLADSVFDFPALDQPVPDDDLPF